VTTPHHPTRRAFLALSAATLALARTPFAQTTAAPATPQPAPLGSVHPGGDLDHRTSQNFTRLQDALYRPPQIFRGTNWQSWPGDMEGRALLAVTLLSAATGTEPPYFPAMVADYPAHLNPHGYFGPTLDLHAINEQQLSGHGWFLRGLCDYYAYKQDPATLAQIRAVIAKLALPLRGQYAVYPIDPALRQRAASPANPGAVDGHLAAQHGDWAVSSDTGCAFIFLDGLTQSWLVLRAAHDPLAPPLKTLIDEAIARFLQIDLVALKAQTHATLTALRAVLRIYAETGDPALLAAVQQRYRLYRTTAMTEHYANTNWFGRPDSWTEPCAIIDSFMLATQLWQHTADPAYLEDAHRIWFNGIGRGLRANGGFGTDTCSGFHSSFVKVRSYEAYFCCTMRGGEAHARAAQYLYFTQPARSGQPAALTLPFYAPSEATLNLGTGPIRLRQTTGYPYTGNVFLEVLAASPTPVTLRLFAPTWLANQRLTVNGKPLHPSAERGFLVARLTLHTGDVLRLDQDLRVAPRSPHNPTTDPSSYAFEAGPLLLAYKPPANPAANLHSPDPPAVAIPRNATLTLTDSHGTYSVADTNLTLSPINDLNETAAPPTHPSPPQHRFHT
jgi:hypothetical protein